MADATRTYSDSDQVLHWYDFVCPFCYVGQSRTTVLEHNGWRVIELPFEAHPEIPLAGKYVGPRSGPMYTALEAEARAAGLPLHWPDRLPNTRRALACAEWVRRNDPFRFTTFQRSLFAAHFVDSEDIGDQTVIDRRADRNGIDLSGMHAALQSGAAYREVDRSEDAGQRAGVQGTPAWLVNGELISGLQPESSYASLLPAQPS